MNNQGAYLYCFAFSASVPDGSLTETEGQKVLIKKVKALAAVYRLVSLDEFAGETGESNMRDPYWVISGACLHERVVEKAMNCSPVVPARFGTVFSSMQALEEFIGRRHDEIFRGLEYVSDKEEWCVKVFADTGKIVERLLAMEPVLVQQGARMSDSPGARYFQQKQLQREAQRRSRSLCRTVAEHFAEELKNISTDLRLLNLRSENHPGAGPEMILNCAVFLPRSRLDDLRLRLAGICAEYGPQGFVQRTSGPWPPYNFCPSLQDFSNP